MMFHNTMKTHLLKKGPCSTNEGQTFWLEKKIKSSQLDGRKSHQRNRMASSENCFRLLH